MPKYAFPAVFAPEENACCVHFPDLPGCDTFGDDPQDAMAMAEDALAMTLRRLEDYGEQIPVPSDANAIDCKPPTFVESVPVDTDMYRKAIVGSKDHL